MGLSLYQEQRLQVQTNISKTATSPRGERTPGDGGRDEGTTCMGCCDHTFCVESQRRSWCGYWLSLRWVTAVWMAEEDMQQAISERLGGVIPDYWGCATRNWGTGGFEYRFVLRKDGQTTPFSRQEMHALELPPATFWRYRRRYPEECFAARFSCCLREIRAPLVDIISGLGEPGAESIGSPSLCAGLQQELRMLPAIVV
ncbi:hypothetical protein H634G_11491 [Metarhizium anisopliae BRIP 53293]|uniref:Uncharacterized protein n=1 Tax=Metarhizium anisopliae BRIP 53293 TaxID=1291518 RepID=A0A0D9NL48_METAN|nr:hypothetical protein H634G_11491 [Metarhizium anisopliae BRIP 53293]KJK84887.1 hypothetical protein H633G_11294 [Metarhizium anisopliae BRIP 53284]